MSYNRDSKRIFIEKNTELLAEEIYLHKKYLKEHCESIEIILNTMINAGWLLNNNEKKIMMKKAVQLVNQKYNLKIRI